MDTLLKARESFDKQEWSKAWRLFSEADTDQVLDPPDLEKWSTAAFLVGKDTISIDVLSRAHQGYLGDQNVERAVRCGFWLAMLLFNKGEAARGGGWVARAQRLLEGIDHDCVEKAYLKIPAALKLMSEGNYKQACATFKQADEISSQYDDADVATLAHLGQGQTLVFQGEIDKGLALLDESMIAVEARDASPLVAGIVYCTVIDVCHKIYDMRRAREWTAALSRWCESQPDMVPYRGQCFVRRAEIMCLQGSWSEAIDEMQKACEWLTEKRPEPAAGDAYYQLGELFRMTGAFEKAEEAYKSANKFGRKPQPGLALLRLYQGQLDKAKASISREYNEKQGPLIRSRLLPAYVEVMLIGDEVEQARRAAEELLEIAETTIRASYMKALAYYAMGRVFLVEKSIEKALELMKESLQIWKDLRAPYEIAQVRMAIGCAYRLQGDEDMAQMELEAARQTFEELGALPDIERMDLLLNDRSKSNTTLSPREIEVLRLISTGATNKSIASTLFISERTVERHVSNIFNKLGVSSRSAATSYAYMQNLI